MRSGAALGALHQPDPQEDAQDGAGFAFPGHTEYLAHLSGAPLPVMMLVAPALRVVPVTIHIPLAARAGSADARASSRRRCASPTRGLCRDFGLDRRRASPSRASTPTPARAARIGHEEADDHRARSSTRLRGEGMALTGPHSADTLFHPAARARYDAAVCMYHDQALIPIKTIDFDGGVNVTLGLDFVRTSPDHGTAYDIAGRGIANPSSLIAALRLAREMAGSRARRA